MVRTLLPKTARCALVAVVACAATGGAARPARAQQEHPPIVLVLDPCAGVDAREVRRLVPIEMGAPLVPGAADPRETTRVSLGCVAGDPRTARLEVHNPTTGKTLERVLALGDVPRVDQARLVAIAAVELVAASWSELGHPSNEAAVAPAPPPPPPLAVPTLVAAPPPRAEAPPTPRWRALAVGSVRGFGGLPRPVAGGGLAAERELGARFAVGLDVLVEGGAQPVALGSVDSLLLSGGAWGLALLHTGPVTWEPGVGLRVGWARLAGVAGATDVRAGALSAPWLGPAVSLRAVAALRAGFVASLGAEGGDAAGGATGHVDGGADVSVEGPWWGATVGLGHVF
jgi:hypothetical protein